MIKIIKLTNNTKAVEKRKTQVLPPKISQQRCKNTFEHQEIMIAQFSLLTKNSHQDNVGTVHIYLKKQAE